MSDIHFNSNPKAINCHNEELSFTDNGWELNPHNRKQYHISIIPVTYDPMVEASRLKQFLSKALNGDIDQATKITVLTPILLSH